jgi:gliding motility-associated lipoprotein GldD
MNTALLKYKVILCVCVAVVLGACGDSTPQPKPYGYFRIDFPEKSYREFQHKQVTFRYPDYATVVIDPMENHQEDWFDISFPAFNAKIHLSYHPINNDFDTLVEDVRALALKHIPKASGIRHTLVQRDSTRVYGLIYDISGVGTASACQFFFSDTTTNFLRGSLYFNITPNNDSLAPIIRFIRQDIDTLAHSLRWTKH